MAAASVWLPGFVRRKKIRELAALTADAFGALPPAFAPGSAAAALEAYALLTRRLADAAQAGEDSPGRIGEVERALGRSAFAFGQSLRKKFRVRSHSDALRLVRLAYMAIGICLEIDATGGIRVPRCFFSRHYSEGTCRVIAALDEGVMSGILGRGTLAFSERITAGQTCCLASFRPTGGEP